LFSGVPQLPQNLVASGFSELQPGQRIPKLPRSWLTAPYHDPALNVIRAQEKLTRWPAGEDPRPLAPARPILLVAVGRGASDAAAVWRHAAEDCDAAVAGWIRGPQKAADFGNENREEEG
jgi:hypothetical protein